MTGTLGYADGVSEPAGLDRPNPRTISNVLFAQNAQTNDPRHRSSFTWAWGQFVDHDLVLAPDTPDEPYPISIPPYDFYFDPAGTGAVTIPMMRSVYLANSGTDPEQSAHPRQ